MISFLDSLLHTFFPRICYGCGTDLARTEQWLCIQCAQNMPVTGYHRIKNNAIERIFWGRIPLEQAASFLFFTKNGMVQHLLHALKYQKVPELGRHLGARYAQCLADDNAFASVDLIVPVPLHPSKQRKRGYNQSEVFALGLSEVLLKPVRNDILIRNTPTETQTHKNRSERWENVKDVFVVNADKKDQLINKHILLTDDVLTTGATLEACAIKLLKIPGVKVSLVTIATAKI